MGIVRAFAADIYKYVSRRSSIRQCGYLRLCRSLKQLLTLESSFIAKRLFQRIFFVCITPIILCICSLLLLSFENLLKYHTSTFIASGGDIHQQSLLTNALLFWHFLENLNFKFKNILEYIRTMFLDNTWLFSETTDSEFAFYYS